MTHFIVSRFGKFQKSVRVLYIVLRVLKNLFIKVKPNKYNIHFDNLSEFIGRRSFMLSILIVLNKHQQSTELFAGETEEVFTVNRQNYECALLTLIREAQLALMPEIFIELEPENFSMTIKHFSGNILFVDEFGLLRVLAPLNEECIPIDWKFISQNITNSKILIPTNKFSKELALQVIRKTHLENHCCSVTYLSQLVGERYYVINLTRLCKFVFNNCFMCLRKRLIDQPEFQ